jgi:hypothetical protein
VNVKIALIVGCVAFGLLASWDIFRTYQVRSWPSSSGRVVDRQMRAEHDSSGDATIYTIVRFDYTVGGTGYHAKQEFQGKEDGMPAGAVTVFYNPADPQEAVLQRPSVFRSWVLLGLIGVLLARVLGFHRRGGA